MIRISCRFLIAASFFISGMLQAQPITFPINLHNGQTIETCSGIFTDSGGSLSPYSGNENFALTISTINLTPPFLRLDFSVFELGAGDIMHIHDGEDADAPLIFSAAGNDLQGEQLWATGSSLHIRFISSDADLVTAAGWVASIACFEQCEAFYTDISTTSGSFDFCPDVQSVSFTAKSGFYGGTLSGNADNISYQWNFDGEIKTGATVSHNYPGPGAYPFRITATDPLSGCVFDSIITVRLATQPIFDNTISTADTVCANETFTLIGRANSIPWTGFPTSVDTIAFITQNQPFISALDFSVFPQGQQITTLTDFDRVCINVEHIDFGHLAFELECPNGTSVLLKDYGTGGANLGEPVVYGPENIPGIGYQYCFSTAPQYGRMNETSFQFHTYTDQAGDIYNFQPYLPAGNYTSVESFQNFTGCPLNGEWVVKVSDQITGTSGHVTGWSMFFNDNFYPDSLIFTPEIVEEKWIDQNGNEVGNNPANVTLSSAGEYKFTFRVLDDFGCNWDTTLTVQVLPLPKAEITSELEIPVCEGDSTILYVTPNLIGDEANWIYQWMSQGENLPGRISDTLMAKQVANYMVVVTDTLTGCFDTFELLFSEQNCDLKIPNVFTPDGNGINDFFEIENLEYYPGSVMVIYNRNGKKVFEHNDYYLNWWDGGNQAQGTYYYVLTYTRLGKQKQIQGVITLIKAPTP
jgi:gliding motility-associated-like protein